MFFTLFKLCKWYLSDRTNSVNPSKKSISIIKKSVNWFALFWLHCFNWFASFNQLTDFFMIVTLTLNLWRSNWFCPKHLFGLGTIVKLIKDLYFSAVGRPMKVFIYWKPDKFATNKWTKKPMNTSMQNLRNSQILDFFLNHKQFHQIQIQALDHQNFQIGLLNF